MAASTAGIAKHLSANGSRDVLLPLRSAGVDVDLIQVFRGISALRNIVASVGGVNHEEDAVEVTKLRMLPFSFAFPQ